DYVSDWARTVQPGAGKDRGWTLLPEVGDEVLVCFEQGDFGRPNVIGGLFNGIDTMPTGEPALVGSMSGSIDRRSLVSRRGHRLDLLDLDGLTEGIRLATSGNKLLISLDAVDTKVTVHADGQVLVEGKKGVTIDADVSDLNLKGGKITLTATKGVQVDGGVGDVSVKSDGQLSLTGMSAKLESRLTTEVKAGAICSVTGALVKIN
ncbi:MAG TPA: phage baseplate assembly protein V, partial [Propionibacteriaceae bacterium]